MTDLEVMIEPRLVKLTVTDYIQLGEARALRDYARTELIDGVIVEKSPNYSDHGFAHSIFLERLSDAVDALGADLQALPAVSVELSRHQMPLPDIVVTSYRGPRAAIPVATVPLLVEIADTTAAFDRGKKARIYAAGGVPEYWVVDIQAGEVARFWEPGRDGYAREDGVSFGEKVVAITLPGLAVETSGI